jgi:hypothetical protein
VTSNSSFKNTSFKGQKTSILTTDPEYFVVGIGKNNFHSSKASCTVSI